MGRSCHTTRQIKTTTQQTINMAKEENLIFGIRAVIEAVNSNAPISKVIIKKGLTGNLASELLGKLKHENIPFQYVPIEAFSKFQNKNHQGVIAYTASIEYQKFDDILPKLQEQNSPPFLLVLDRVTDVRNFGAIVRTAECAGVDAIIVPAKGAASVGSDAIKTSAGALYNVPICRVGSLKMFCYQLKDNGFRIISASEKGKKDLYNADFAGPIAIVMGAEDTGIHPEVLKLSDEVVRIPLKGKIESLNVSVATGVMLYEALRQRSL
ncbi:MAG: rRNA (guanosine2251-2-O)-methyltransferase [Tenuifilum sp.]|nr:rRNA (guanosine2251-2-O)-methyltransferase [Tenuifilum sp.]